jgi:hypothetical protein
MKLLLFGMLSSFSFFPTRLWAVEGMTGGGVLLVLVRRLLSITEEENPANAISIGEGPIARSTSWGRSLGVALLPTCIAAMGSGVLDSDWPASNADKFDRGFSEGTGRTSRLLTACIVVTCCVVLLQEFTFETESRAFVRAGGISGPYVELFGERTLYCPFLVARWETSLFSSVIRKVLGASKGGTGFIARFRALGEMALAVAIWKPCCVVIGKVSRRNPQPDARLLRLQRDHIHTTAGRSTWLAFV